MRPRVYIETSVSSVLAARPSRDLIVAAHQQISHAWSALRDQWDLSISALVIAEARADDSEAARRREALLQGLPALRLGDGAVDLAEQLLRAAALPAKAREDALHIALAAVHGVDYLLTWNCKHIANAAKRPTIERICESAGYRSPIICTPEELVGEPDVDRPDH